MSARLRPTAVLATLAFLPLAPLLLGRAEPPAAAVCAAAEQDGARPDPDSAKTCGQCHTEFYREWHGRAHSKAWIDEIYQEQLKGKKRPQVCHGCHIPADVHQRLGRKPKPREKLLDEGVTCVSCHKSERTKGAILGPFGAKTDAHPSEKNPAFTASGAEHLCSSCHGTKIGPVLPLARDHAGYRKKLGAEAKGCVECHMPEVERHLAVSIVTGEPVGEKRTTRSHAVLGPSDAEFCAKAFELGARADGRDLVVSVGNRAGHRIPGLTLRQFVIAVNQLGADGAQLATHQIVVSHENVIQVLETREFRFDLAAGAASAELHVDHVFQDAVVARILTVKSAL